MGITHFDPSAPHIIFRTRLLGPRSAEWADLILDTGATHIVIDELVAYRLSYDLLIAPTVSLTTVSGTTRVPVITVRQLFALGEAVDNFEVLAMPLPLQLRADNLLGLDFLRRHNLFCNFDKSVLPTLPFTRSLLYRLILMPQIFIHL